MTDTGMPISFVLESNVGGLPATLCLCGAILYQPMAIKHVEQCAIAAADLPVPGEPPACDDCGEHHEGYGDCPALPEETPDA